jgi:multidrug efflux pump subunit AcrA (membrane-fusion protein)
MFNLAYAKQLFMDTIQFKIARTAVRVVYAVLLALVAFIGFSGDESAVVEEVVTTPSVEVRSVSDLASGRIFTAVGSVAAVSEARLQTESGGRVTSVNADIGDAVAAGTILATLENNSERASLLQAEGAYEAAVAGAEQSDSGLRGSEIALQSAKEAAQAEARGAYTAVNDVLITTIDQFYSNPQSPSLPGVRVSGDTSFLSSERIAFQTIMPKWQASVATPDATNLNALLLESEANVTRMITLLDNFIQISSDAKNTDTLLGSPLTSYSAELLARRSALNGVYSGLQSTRSNLTSAEENVRRASIGGTSGTLSVANAQVKIALGSLRAAQANYEKTIVRTPISGVVNAMYLKVGEYASPSAPAAIVANNNGLEIKTAVNQVDSMKLSIGDQVTIDKTSTGTITAIAGAIDPTTGKVAVNISVNSESELQNGVTALVTFAAKTESVTTEIILPLSAIKMTGSGPVVFTVDAASKELTSIPVVLGAVSGSNVLVSEGVTLESEIVVDARGLKAGQVVTTN